MAITSKTWDYDLPFTRINSPSDRDDHPEMTTLSGDGHTQGTRRPADFLDRSWLDLLVRQKLARVTPSWVPTLSATPVKDGQGVLREDMAQTERMVDNELQGVLVKSFQTWTDAPPLQYHWWYDWNFHVVPDSQFDWLRGAGNAEADFVEFKTDVPTTSAALETVEDIPLLGSLVHWIASVKKGRAQYVVPGRVMECEWDAGSFGKGALEQTNLTASGPQRLSGIRPGPMYGPQDWAWPMPGHRVWLRGRSIYDGGHETEAKLCRSELHPCKAVAWARWEAEKFDENNGKYVPAIQFMFFTSKFGGYVDHKDIAPFVTGSPYEFIVDLPPAPIDGPLEIDIADSTNVNLNTVVIRKAQLCKKIDRTRYASSGTRQMARFVTPPADVDPIIELLPLAADATDPTKRQAKITIPRRCADGRRVRRARVARLEGLHRGGRGEGAQVHRVGGQVPLLRAQPQRAVGTLAREDRRERALERMGHRGRAQQHGPHPPLKRDLRSDLPVRRRPARVHEPRRVPQLGGPGVHR